MHNQGNHMAQVETKTKIKANQDLARPSLFKVIYINDNQTAMEFVIETLIAYFDYNGDSAHEKTMDIHNSGSAVVAVLPYEIAEQKGIEITVQARSLNYPLQIKLEPDDA